MNSDGRGCCRNSEEEPLEVKVRLESLPRKENERKKNVGCAGGLGNTEDHIKHKHT